jgi:selenocysteine-specific elongation factor
MSSPRVRVVATAGHVDHGKSSLVLALTGTDPDRFAEEKRRGLTIDLGFAHADLPGGDQVSFIDVPGHVRFLRNMLAGVGGVDACLFVVAATEGWKPQSEEHLRILELLGIRAGLVVLTKVDLVDDEWLELQTLDVLDRLAGTFLADAPIIGVSAHTGAGLDELRSELASLVERTDAALDIGRPRLWVDRSFAAKGSGTVVTGTLTGGGVAVDDHLTVGPTARRVRVRSIQSHGHAVDAVGPGRRVALNLSGVDHHEVERGHPVVMAAQWRPSRRVDASLDVLASLDHAVSRRGAYVAYLGSGEFPVRVRILGPDRLDPGDRGLVRLHLPEPLPLVIGDRFVLRESGRDETIGGGAILDVAPALPASRARPDGTIDTLVRERGWVLIDDLAAWTTTVVQSSDTTAVLGSWAVSVERLAERRAHLLATAEAAGATGLDLAALDELDRLVLGTLEADGAVEVHSGRACVAGSIDPYADHPVIDQLRRGGTAPEEPSADRATLRELARRGVLVDRDGIWFHIDAIDVAARTMATLLVEHPDGVTMAQLRDALGITRKFAVPLATELDARGITRRRGDLRIGGPRLPTV